ncbi:hypothetical protein [Hymenobacter cellulosivorans]|uniref:Uncharacterized protein n=1 Tax=Hymenobacter cellulosivorans TaxID=2932249 RepID=A0ABY4F5M2_9BACT|nr:hypothetical protein [Hymenobacter cellulosivorans]UOQ51823.1 hypothetical protein MUN80_18920 [Hymenobacter cellulosivorans]
MAFIRLPHSFAKRRMLYTGGRFLYGVLGFVLVVLVFRWMMGDDRVQVTTATALSGRVTKCDVNRQHYYWYLDDKPVRYDLWSFTAGDSATQRMQDQILARNKDNIYYYNTLAYYIKKGDELQKAANSPLLTLRRGNQLTTWTCAPDTAK